MRRVATIGVFLIAIAAILLLLLRSRGGGGEPAAGTDDGDQRRGMAGPRLAGPPALPGGESAPLGPRNLPPPPPGFDPGSPSRAVDPAARKLAEGVFPVRPPYFEDPEKRAEFRAWWLREMKRRYRAYKADRDWEFPDDETADELFDRLYDLGEGARPDETQDQFDDRAHDWSELLSEFDEAFGTRPIGIISYGADPQHGDPEEPPFLPAGAEETFEEHPDRAPAPTGDGDEAPDFGPAGRR